MPHLSIFALTVWYTSVTIVYQHNYPCTFSFFPSPPPLLLPSSSPPLLPSSFRQDVDGKHRVEIVRKLEVEKPQSPSDSGNEDDPLIPVINEKVVLLPSKQTVQYFEHRHLRYFYSEEAGKYLLLR